MDIEALERLENNVFDAYGVNSRPAGALWVQMVLDLARQIVDAGMEITPADLDALTEENYHTARHAAEIVLHLQKYA